MDGYEKYYLGTRPDNLCHMCGWCCRVATTSIPYNKIIELAKEGDEGAKDFLELFEPYPSIEDAKKVSEAVVENIINGLKEDGNYNEDNMTFYKCRYLTEDNLCSRYETRMQLCKHFPASPWAIVPPGCGYEGWLFMKREEAKQKIRKIKEELIELELLKKKTGSSEVLSKITTVISKMHHSIELYKKHGSENW